MWWEILPFGKGKKFFNLSSAEKTVHYHCILKLVHV